MDEENSLHLQVSHFISEGTGDEVKKVENWLRRKHDGLFRAILINGANNKLEIQCYCNSTFVVGFNDKNDLKSRFIEHKKTCRAFLQFAETKLPRKRYAEALEGDFSPVLNREEELDMPSNNLSENLPLSNPSPLAFLSSHNIVGEVSFFSYSEREMKPFIKLFKRLNLFLFVV
jgi:hypothetical protein